MVRSLLDAGVPLARIRRAVTALLDALRHGQLALFVAVDRIADDVDAEVRAFARDRQSFVDRLRTDHPAGSG